MPSSSSPPSLQAATAPPGQAQQPPPRAAYAPPPTGARPGPGPRRAPSRESDLHPPAIASVTKNGLPPVLRKSSSASSPCGRPALRPRVARVAPPSAGWGGAPPPRAGSEAGTRRRARRRGSWPARAREPTRSGWPAGRSHRAWLRRPSGCPRARAPWAGGPAALPAALPPPRGAAPPPRRAPASARLSPPPHRAAAPVGAACAAARTRPTTPAASPAGSRRTRAGGRSCPRRLPLRSAPTVPAGSSGRRRAGRSARTDCSRVRAQRRGGRRRRDVRARATARSRCPGTRAHHGCPSTVWQAGRALGQGSGPAASSRSAGSDEASQRASRSSSTEVVGRCARAADARAFAASHRNGDCHRQAARIRILILLIGSP